MTTQINGDTGVSKVQDGVVVTDDLANGSVTQAKLSASVVPLGVGQTWQAFSSPNRTSGTPYINSTGRPIMVNVCCQDSGSGVSANALVATVSGVTVGYASTNATYSRPMVSFVVPDGATYVVTYTGTLAIQYWSELR